MRLRQVLATSATRSCSSSRLAQANMSMTRGKSPPPNIVRVRTSVAVSNMAAAVSCAISRPPGACQLVAYWALAPLNTPSTTMAL